MDNYDIMAESCPNCVAAEREIDILESRLDAADREMLATLDIDRARLTAADALAAAAKPFTVLLIDGNSDDVDVAPWNFIRAGNVQALIVALRKYREATE